MPTLAGGGDGGKSSRTRRPALRLLQPKNSL